MGKGNKQAKRQEKVRTLAKGIVAEVNRLLEEEIEKSRATMFMRKNVYDHIVGLNKKVDVTNDGS